MTLRWVCVGARAHTVSREGNAARLAALGVTFRATAPAIAAPPNHGSPKFTWRRRRCGALARGDSSAWLNAQLAGERAVIPLAARTINRDAVSGRESSSALTLKDTCAETVNVSVTDGLASDTSVTTALTRNTTDLAFKADDRTWLQVHRGGSATSPLLRMFAAPPSLPADGDFLWSRGPQDDLRDIAAERSCDRKLH